MANCNPVFDFPFEPYAIQERFMKELYFTIENKKSGIFESPTGTGKSLSICCSTLKWLKDSSMKAINDLKEEINRLQLETCSSNNSNDWLQEEYSKIKKCQTLNALCIQLEKLTKQSEQYLEMKKRVLKQNNFAEIKLLSKSKSKNDIFDNSEVKKQGEADIEDYDLIIEQPQSNEDQESDNEEIPEDENKHVKIYISSRTHSQLSQFVGEIKQTSFKDNTRVVTLASRQHYCINDSVSKLKNVNLINERCLDMQKIKSKSTSTGDDGKVLKKTKRGGCLSCQYYNQTNITKLKEILLCEIMDMEDLLKAGKEVKACPYYASRAALDDAEVVLVSHAGIVSEGARSGMSLKLKDNILILDEAHALTSALENAYSAPVSARYLDAVRRFLKQYINKYRSRLSSKNLLALNQLQYIVTKLSGVLSTTNKEIKQENLTITTLEEFVIATDIDHLNLRSTIEFCKGTKLAPKLHGFAMRYTPQMLQEEEQKAVNKKKSLEVFLKSMSKKNSEVQEVQPEQQLQDKKIAETETSPGTGLYAVLEFLQMLCERSEYGRVLVKKGDNGMLKYLLLNPTDHFVDVVKQCRSVVVAGGTMEPIEEFVNLLTGDPNNLKSVNVVKCDHVVPPDNIIAVCLSKGPTNATLSFTYEHRMSAELLNEVGRILRNVCNIVPGGVVCFLPSYTYEQTLFDHLKTQGQLESIKKRKHLFREPKSAADVDQVLSKFAASVRNKNSEQNGALLLSVVGGKLSEGLNFSDDLGRCVIVVGMPYPNIKSPELQEKMNYLNKSIGPGAGNAYYEGLCMKAVNQCIGRAVRHANDYACVVLIDERYSRPQTTAALPTFVQKSLIADCTFGKAIGTIGKFFNKFRDVKR
ncbi:hypothetical protein ACJJTC_012362 [Scirpophaga incertulas]